MISLRDRALLYSMRMRPGRRVCGVIAAAALGAAGAPAAGRHHLDQQASRVHLRDVAAGAGVRFVRHIGSTSEKFYVDSAPGGLAIFDYNGDGRPDIFFTDGAELPALEKRLPADANRLYRNEGNMRFTDVTDEAGVAGVGYAMGVAAADYDNDGHVDLFVAGVRRNQLLRNRGDGRFDDVTARAGVAGGEWAVAACDEHETAFGDDHSVACAEPAGIRRSAARHRLQVVADWHLPFDRARVQVVRRQRRVRRPGG